jgi:hypothetical protein
MAKLTQTASTENKAAKPKSPRKKSPIKSDVQGADSQEISKQQREFDNELKKRVKALSKTEAPDIAKLAAMREMGLEGLQHHFEAAFEIVTTAAIAEVARIIGKGTVTEDAKTAAWALLADVQTNGYSPDVPDPKGIRSVAAYVAHAMKYFRNDDFTDAFMYATHACRKAGFHAHEAGLNDGRLHLPPAIASKSMNKKATERKEEWLSEAWALVDTGVSKNSAAATIAKKFSKSIQTARDALKGDKPKNP